MSSLSDYYELLGVKRDATEVDIRAAYREAALRWHPDRNLGSAEQAEPMFERVTEAYEVLIDQQKRASYDQTGEAPAREDSSTDQDSPARGRLGAALSVFESLFANPEAVKGYLSGEGVGPDAQPSPPADDGTVAGMRCEAGHRLQFSTASAGTCDRCGRPVQSGEKLLDCRSCNYYLCFGCHPVTRCPAGHGLQTSAAIVGECSGCQRRLQKGDLVMDCRRCGWHVCAGCCPPARCPGGHGLQPWANQFQGACDGCHRGVQRGEVVMDCRRCDWYLCMACCSTGGAKPRKADFWESLSCLPRKALTAAAQDLQEVASGLRSFADTTARASGEQLPRSCLFAEAPAHGLSRRGQAGI